MRFSALWAYLLYGSSPTILCPPWILNRKVIHFYRIYQSVCSLISTSTRPMLPSCGFSPPYGFLKRWPGRERREPCQAGVFVFSSLYYISKKHCKTVHLGASFYNFQKFVQRSLMFPAVCAAVYVHFFRYLFCLFKQDVSFI